MAAGLLLPWFIVALSGTIIFLKWKGILKKGCHVCIVSFIYTACVLGLYYSPLSGINYYLANLLLIEPLIILLVFLASRDPNPNWSYRGMCLIFIFIIVTLGLHILTDKNFAYYDDFSLTASILEILVLLTGGLNVRLTIFDNLFSDHRRAVFSNTWVRHNFKD